MKHQTQTPNKDTSRYRELHCSDYPRLGDFEWEEGQIKGFEEQIPQEELLTRINSASKRPVVVYGSSK